MANYFLPGEPLKGWEAKIDFKIILLTGSYRNRLIKYKWFI